jgi:hypothetical protein
MSWQKKIFGSKQINNSPDVPIGESPSKAYRETLHVSSQYQPAQNRQIRVFISSTFRDMQADRDVLVKEHPDTLMIVNNLASLLQSKGDYVGSNGRRKNIVPIVASGQLSRQISVHEE